MADTMYTVVVIAPKKVALVRSSAGDPDLGYVVALFVTEDQCRNAARLLNAATQVQTTGTAK